MADDEKRINRTPEQIARSKARAAGLEYLVVKATGLAVERTVAPEDGPKRSLSGSYDVKDKTVESLPPDPTKQLNWIVVARRRQERRERGRPSPSIPTPEQTDLLRTADYATRAAQDAAIAAVVPPQPPRPGRKVRGKGDPFEIRVQVSVKETGSDALLRGLDVLLTASPAQLRLMEEVVIRSVVRNIRTRFLKTMERSLEMKVLKKNGKDVSQQIKVRKRDVKLKGRMQTTLEQINEAQLSGNFVRVASLRKRLAVIEDRLRTTMGKSPGGNEWKSSDLSLKTGNVFRRQLFKMLGLLTDSQFVSAGGIPGGVAVGVGPIAELDKLETPSATQKLIGVPTPSRYKSFWRHLEFGTGAQRKAFNNPGRNKSPRWWYGTNPEKSLLLEGTSPMNFLTNNFGKVYPEDLSALEKAFSNMLIEVLGARR